jgi:hypothetical protein
MNRRILFLVAAAFAATLAPGASGFAAEKGPPPAQAVRRFSSQEREPAFNPRRFLFSPEVVADEKDGGVRLAHSVLVADEVGATDFHQTEELSERVWARKVFRLDSADVAEAELFVFHGAKQVLVNGKALAGSDKLASTGWTRAKVPPELLQAGDNEVVLAGGGSLLLEPSRQPGHSSKSTDGGKTWSADALGKDGDQRGEYVVRLRLGRYAPRGWAMSPVFDLWAVRPGDLATPGKVVTFEGLTGLAEGQPPGTRVVASLRTGSTPTPDAKTWTDWITLDKGHQPDARAERHHWAQLKFDLTTTRPQATPRLPASFEVRYTFQEDAGVAGDKLEVTASGNGGDLLPPSPPFTYQAPSPRLKLLRERYQLDKVIAPGKTEMEQLMLLRHWVRNQWHTAWGSHPASWMPPWDALIILESKDQPDCLTMCTHYATVFTHCCIALGWNARHCILDHHCVAEVWVGQHNKWVMMDAGNSAQRADVGLHFERQSVPLSARELHLAQRDGKADGVEAVFTPAALAEKIAPLCRPAPEPKVKPGPRPDRIPVSELGKYPVCGLENYRRYAFPGRNNQLASLYPGELYQGWSEYYYDGYWWVGDSPDAPVRSPEYSRHLDPARAQDIDWPLNGSRVHLCRTTKAGELQVDLETQMPNLARMERWAEEGEGKGSWKPTAASFVWKLQPGANVLRVRSVNQWDRPGSEAEAQVRWAAGGR